MTRTLRNHLSLTVAAVALSLSVPAAAQDMQNNRMQNQNAAQQEQMNTQDTTQQNRVFVDPRSAASEILDQRVYNEQNERVGMVEDIILSQNGDALKAIIRHNDLFGIGGDYAAVDYKEFSRNKTASMDGDSDVISVIMPESQIENAQSFAYTQEEADELDTNINVMVQPEDTISTAYLLEDSVYGPDNEQLAEIENVLIRYGEAQNVVIELEGILGLEEKLVAMSFDSLTFTQMDGEAKPQLNAQNAQKLKAFQQERARQQQNNQG